MTSSLVVRRMARRTSCLVERRMRRHCCQGAFLRMARFLAAIRATRILAKIGRRSSLAGRRTAIFLEAGRGDKVLGQRGGRQAPHR